MNWEDFFKLLAGGLSAIVLAFATFYAKDILGQLKELSAALRENTIETRELVKEVKRLDKENTSLRNSHDVLTRYLISRGILPPPDPSQV